jgi:hypothetical protein
MSLTALVYRSRARITIPVESLGAVKDDRTGEYYFPTSEHDGKFPPEDFIAREFWIGNVTGVAELRQDLAELISSDSLLQTKVLYSGSHSGDIIEVALLPVLEEEIQNLLNTKRLRLSEHDAAFLKGMLELIEVAKTEQNPIVFV